MYIVRRPFRNFNQIMTPGSVVEPGAIKRFKTRLKDRTIVEVTPQTLDAWNEYFVGKFGVSIKSVAAKAAPKAVTEGKTTTVSSKPVTKIKK